jgi:preprotein translocase subunit SecY
MTGVVPRLQALSREGEYGRTKINQYTRYLTVPLALLQAYGYLAILYSSGIITEFDILSIQTLGQMITLAAGTVLAMWIGELITERGIGNGISFIIFAGIVARVPQGLAAYLASPDIAGGVAFVILGIAVVAGIVFIQEGQRRIPIQYASRVRGRRMYQGGATFLPLRVNQAGVIPIIFAVSILLFPTQIASYFATPPGAEASTIVNQIADFIVNFLRPQGLPYIVFYFLLTMGFTYFYTAFTFKPDETADQLRKNGGFIPGIRPGAPTRDYLQKVVFRLSLAGAIFLAVIAVSPIVLSTFFQGGVLGGFALGGTALLIVVSVVVETMKQIEAQLMMRNYEGFIR